MQEKVEKKEGGLPISYLSDVNLQIIVEMGRVELTIKELLRLKQGSVIQLDKVAGEALDIYANGNIFGRGEGVVVNDKFGVRVTQIVAVEGDGEIF